MAGKAVSVGESAIGTFGVAISIVEIVIADAFSTT